jgi:hypothetical protein
MAQPEDAGNGGWFAEPASIPRHARPCAGHDVFLLAVTRKDVDGWGKPGHDERLKIVAADLTVIRLPHPDPIRKTSRHRRERCQCR